ncbi:hypothetical protein H310_11328 [Aphanomyces invadans]|uniref:Uncharacterized protein n=1 Tax=Aphanomyces invadans TaxID=157072 RepID=A0A024TNU2_9STRA|nr:hypothetical protein H310_11328 [Aphanomyces invadans]ETV95002.1 hypothetical protein H310_11328 [Aphanomyces invadans]|eukprot:XP_008876175.1 hypothetical protein H310_11328 [Aphanomyces invadans]
MMFHGTTSHATSSPPSIVEKKRTVSVHSSPLSPRRPPTLHRSSSIDLTVLSEDSTHAHHILQTMDESDEDAHAFLEHSRQGHVTFHRVQLPGHELGFFAVVGATHLVLWNSHPVHRAIGGKDSPALHLQTLTTLAFPPEMTPLADRADPHVVLAATSYHNASKICALLISRNGRICFWDDISSSRHHGGSSVPVVTRLSMDDSAESVVSASSQFPVIAATTSQTLWEIKLDDDDRSSLRVSKLRSRRQGLWSHVTRFLTSSTPSPVLLTKSIPTSSELLVLHVDSTLTRCVVASSASHEALWSFQLCGFLMDYFAQHEDGILVYAQCLALPFATSTHFSLVVGFQTGTNVLLYLFEFLATMADLPQYRRSLRVGTVPSLDQIQSVPVNDQSLYLVTPTTLFAVSVPAFPDMPLHVHAISLPHPIASGVGVLHQSLLYLHTQHQPPSVRQIRSFEWTLTPTDSILPDPKRYKVTDKHFASTTLDLHQHRSLAEWKAVLVDRFQQFDISTVSFHVDLSASALPGGLSQAVVELAHEIIDAKPATGLHWGKDQAGSVYAPQLVKYQLQEKSTRYRHFLRFLTSTGLLAMVQSNARHQLVELNEKLVAATAALVYAEDHDQVDQKLLRAMHAVLVNHRGYTTDQMDATGFSVLDLFYGDVSHVHQLAMEWLPDTNKSASNQPNVIVAMLQAVEAWRRDQDVLAVDESVGEMDPWTAQPAIRTACRRMLQAGDRTRALLMLVPNMVPYMDAEEKSAWAKFVLVPLVASALTPTQDSDTFQELVVDLVYSFEFLEGIAVLSPERRLHEFIEGARPDIATFFFQWYAGLVSNPWATPSSPSKNSPLDLNSLLHPPSSLLPALYAFLKSQRGSNLAQYAWMVAVQLDKFDDVASCAYADATASSDISLQKTMLSIGKLAALATQTPSTATTTPPHTFDRALLRVRVEEALQLPQSLPVDQVLQACLDEMAKAVAPAAHDTFSHDGDKTRVTHWIGLALDVVLSCENDRGTFDALKRQFWRHAVRVDAPLWQHIVTLYSSCTSETEVEHAMRTTVVYLAGNHHPSTKLTPDLIDVLVKDPTLTGISIKARPLLVKTLALVDRTPP